MEQWGILCSDWWIYKPLRIYLETDTSTGPLTKSWREVYQICEATGTQGLERDFFMSLPSQSNLSNT